jgi:sugar phosphate isomerase/epimerase
MSSYSANIDDFGMDSRTLAGPLGQRLQAVRDAGFTQIMLSAADLASHPQGLATAVAGVRASGLRVTGFLGLRDFEGLSGPMQAYKLDVAKSMLATCHALGCHLLVLDASSQPQSSSDSETLARNLRQLAMLAIPKNIRIAYRANPHSHSVRDFAQAWDVLCLADMPNLGLCLDAVDVLASASTDNDLDMLDTDRLFLVQLADQMGTTANAFRVFPGEGEHAEAMVTFITTLHRLGYRGDYSLAVFNPDYLQMPTAAVAQRARSAALWLGQDVLQRSVPLPNQIRLKHRVP